MQKCPYSSFNFLLLNFNYFNTNVQNFHIASFRLSANILSFLMSFIHFKLLSLLTP
jgi:hypothetical protein